MHTHTWQINTLHKEEICIFNEFDQIEQSIRSSRMSAQIAFDVQILSINLHFFVLMHSIFFILYIRYGFALLLVLQANFARILLFFPYLLLLRTHTGSEREKKKERNRERDNISL